MQWFRAEAEVQRWQEQTELKLAEILRTIRTFRKMSSVWSGLSETQPPDRRGTSAYAKQKAAMYHRRMQEGEQCVIVAGYGQLLEADSNLIEFVREERAKAEKLFVETMAQAFNDVELD